MRRVLFVDDEPQVLESLRDALRPRRREWSMAFATGAGLSNVQALVLSAGADALVNECEAVRGAGSDGCPEPLDLDYIQRLGVAQRVPEWRALTARELERV